MWIPLQVLTSSSHNFSYTHHHDNVAIKHSDISEYSIWYSQSDTILSPWNSTDDLPIKAGPCREHHWFTHTLSADSPNLLFQYSIEFCLPVHLSKVGVFFFLFKRNVATKISIVYQIFTWTSSKCAIHKIQSKSIKYSQVVYAHKIITLIPCHDFSNTTSRSQR